MITARSTELFAKAKTLMPGGVNSPVRAFGSVGREPLFIAGSHGDRITDADGNEYTDYVCSSVEIAEKILKENLKGDKAQMDLIDRMLDDVSTVN